MKHTTIILLLFLNYFSLNLSAQNYNPKWNCANTDAEIIINEFRSNVTVYNLKILTDSLKPLLINISDSLCKSKILFEVALTFNSYDLNADALNLFQEAKKFGLNQIDSLNLIILDLAIARELYFNGKLNEAQNIFYTILQTTINNEQVKLWIHAESFFYLAQIFQQTKIFDKAMQYYDVSHNNYLKLNHIDGIIETIIAVGFMHISTGNNDSAFYLFEKALKLSIENKLELKKGISLSNRAICFYNQGKKTECLNDLTKALEIVQKYGKTRTEAVLLNNIAYFHVVNGKPELSINLLEKSEEKAILSGSKRQLKTTYETFFQAYESLKNYEKAFYYSKKYNQIKDALLTQQLENSLSVMSASYESEKKDKEIEMLKISKQLNESNLQKQELIILGISILLFLGTFFLWLFYHKQKIEQIINHELNQKNEEIKQQREEILVQKNILEVQNKHLEELSTAIKHTDNVIMIFSPDLNLIYANEAFEKTYGFSLKNFEGTQNLFQIIKRFEIPNIHDFIHQAKSSKTSIIFANLRRDRNKNAIWIQSNITPLFNELDELEKFIIVESDISNVKKAEGEILKQNIYINESIHYAKNIQQTILPEKAFLSQFFDFYIIYKPKETVSGDFYWFYSMSAPHENWSSLAAIVDCTGHGVPGAFMSLIANAMLQDVVKYRQIYQPETILKTLKEMIKLVFPNNDGSEGFEIAICRIDRIDTLNYLITYSGAKIPLYYKHIYKNSFERIKGTNESINVEKNKVLSFESHTLKLQSGDQLVLASDGIIDIADENRKRLGTFQFMEILNQSANLNREIACQYTNDFISSWLKNSSQRDDIAIWNIALK